MHQRGALPKVEGRLPEHLDVRPESLSPDQIRFSRDLGNVEAEKIGAHAKLAIAQSRLASPDKTSSLQKTFLGLIELEPPCREVPEVRSAPPT
jgi:hypothetical protein